MASSAASAHDAVMASLAALRLRVAVFAAAVGSCLCFASPVSAQSAASVEGRAVDAAGAPIRNAVVRLVADSRSHTGTHPWRYTLLADSVGKFSQGGLAPGAYLVMLFSGSKAESVWRTVSLPPNATTQIDLKPSSSESKREPGRSSPAAHSSMMRVSSRTSDRAR